MSNRSNDLAAVALEWHIEQGADEVLQDKPADRTVMPDLPKKPDVGLSSIKRVDDKADLLGSADARKESQKLADECNTLEELAEAIKKFDGLSVKKTATNMVFSDGNPAANVMLVGEAPGADEDRQGKPFVGVSGQLLDVILAHIDLSRKEEESAKAIYISNILNWRPPGNRTPTPAEVDIALPFIEKHIALIQPKILILCGGVSAKALLGSGDSISRLRGKFHPFRPQTLKSESEIKCIATYHPSYLLRTPSQKGKVWSDMLMLKKELKD